MPRRVTLLACVAWLLLAGSATAGALRPAPVCGPAAARTLAADRVARVYSQNGDVFGCAQDGERSYKLGANQSSTREGRAGPIALAGTVAGYGLTSYGVDTVSAQIVVRRLTDGRVLRQRSAISGSVGPEFFETVDDIVVKRDGSVAWIADATWLGNGPGRHGITEVRKADRTGRTRLDNGDQIRKRSLRLKGSRLTWRDGSIRKSATLR